MTFVASGSDLSSPSPTPSDSSGPHLDRERGSPDGAAARDDGSNGSWVTEEEQVEDGAGDGAEGRLGGGGREEREGTIWSERGYG